MVSLVQRHIEALEDFMKETLQNFNNFLPELKANILLYAQVTSGPFNARRVNLNALCDVTDDQLEFDVHFPSGAEWEEFTSKWRNCKDFYLDEDLSETSVVTAKKGYNSKTGEGSMRENEASSNLEEANDMP